jgi:hypothetical protein
VATHGQPADRRLDRFQRKEPALIKAFVATLRHERDHGAGPSQAVRTALDQHRSMPARELCRAITELYGEISPAEWAQIFKEGPYNVINAASHIHKVFPDLPLAELSALLTAVGYEPTEVEQSLKSLFPRQVAWIGPAGVPAMPFDDTQIALSLGLRLSQIRIHHGNIIDAVQCFYGQDYVALPHHGGGGGGTDIILEPGDSIRRISGFYGWWFAGCYILQLTIETRAGRIYGPLGDMAFSSQQQPFELTAGDGQTVVALFGSVAYGNNGQSLFLGSLGMAATAG